MQENKKKTEQELFLLTEENKKLNRENDYFKREEVKLQEMVQSQKDEMTLLQNELCQQKAQFQGQNVVVDVLLKQVVSVSSYLLRFSVCRWSPHYTCNNLDQINYLS